MKPFPLVIAHRGASSIAPENTMAAFKKAFEIGCDAIELDVHLSKDEHVVVIHDNLLDRTTNGSGFVKDYTLSELKDFDAGKYFSEEFAGTKIPALSEVLEFISALNIKLIIELKGDYEKLDMKVVELIHRYNCEDKAIISSFNHNYLKNIKNNSPSILTEVDLLFTFENIIEYAKKLKVDIICPIYFFAEQLSRWNIQRLKKNNIKLYTFTVNREEKMIELIEKRVDGIMTDKPDLLLKLKKHPKPEKDCFLFRLLKKLFCKLI